MKKGKTRTSRAWHQLLSTINGKRLIEKQKMSRKVKLRARRRTKMLSWDWWKILLITTHRVQFSHQLCHRYHRIIHMTAGARIWIMDQISSFKVFWPFQIFSFAVFRHFLFANCVGGKSKKKFSPVLCSRKKPHHPFAITQKPNEKFLCTSKGLKQANDGLRRRASKRKFTWKPERVEEVSMIISLFSWCRGRR